MEGPESEGRGQRAAAMIQAGHGTAVLAKTAQQGTESTGILEEESVS